MSDIAKQAGVSTATVSRTFSASEKISSETRERVMQAAELLDYRPRRRGVLKEAKTGRRVTAAQHGPEMTIGFQFFAAQSLDRLLSNTFYTSILAGAQAEAQRIGLNMLLHSTDRSGLFRQPPLMLSDGALGGLLLVGTASPNVVEMFADRVPSIVLIDNRDESGRYDHFVADDFGGGYAATRYLIDLGHRRIAFYAPEPWIPTFHQRRRGYLCALFEAGIPPDQRLILEKASSDFEMLKTTLATDLMEPGKAGRPTAVFAANDFYATVASATFRQMGLSVPGDISLVGFDDVHTSQHAHPPLTTVRIDKEALGRQAVRCLYTLMQRGSEARTVTHPERHELSVGLIVRDSCRAL